MNMQRGEQTTVGLIGLGLIGSELIGRLVKSGIQVIGWDIDQSARDNAVTRGARVASSQGEVFEAVAVVLLSLPNHSIVHDLLASIRLDSRHVIIDTTTGSAEAAEAAFATCRLAGAEYVDATISGSSSLVQTGDATMIVGASERGWDLVDDLLHKISNVVFHVGPPGSGARMKLITNLVLGLNRAALAEGLALAQRQGLDLAMTLHLLRNTPAYSRIMDAKGPKMIQQDFTPQARLSQHLKDVRLMLDCAAECAIELPLTEAHRRILERVEELGYGDLDNSALIKFYGES